MQQEKCMPLVKFNCYWVIGIFECFSLSMEMYVAYLCQVNVLHVIVIAFH